MLSPFEGGGGVGDAVAGPLLARKGKKRREIANRVLLNLLKSIINHPFNISLEVFLK
jgi:hypothetical protein